MAAFLQKLFKSRKNTVTPPPAQLRNPRLPDKEEDQRPNEQDARREQQQALLANGADELQLEEMALAGVTAEIRLKAANGLTNREALQRVQKAAKSRDKGVYQVVRQKLTVIREAEEQRQQTVATIEQLVKQASDQAASEDTKLFQARLETLLKQWSEVESAASTAQTAAFLEAVHKCRERLRDLQAAAEKLQQDEQKTGQREETLTLLAQTLDELKTHPDDALPSLSSLDALQKTQENRWLEATRDTQVSQQEQKAYQNLMLPLRAYITALRALVQHRDELTELASAGNPADETSTQRAAELIKEINWPVDYAKPALLKALAQAAGKKKQPAPATRAVVDQSSQVAELTAVIGKLDQALEAKQLKESRQLFKTAQQQLKALDHRHGKPFQARMQLLGGQLRELSDWAGFVTQPKQVVLCEQMEYLAEQPMEPEAKATRIKELQNEWRELGGSSDRTLWARFKQASDAAYEPCKEYFSAKSGLKHANLQKREAICRELETFVGQADWSAIDWKAAERIHRTARDEWKAAWPVEFRDNRGVQKQFDHLLRQIEEPLDAERTRNEALKSDIVQRAEALISHEPLSEAMNLAKSLQEEWTAVGITRHREDRKLWQAFRKACDAIFARREAQRNEQQEETRQADRQLEELLGRTGQLNEQAPQQEIAAQLEQLRATAALQVSKAQRERRTREEQRLAALVDQQRQAARVQEWIHAVRGRLDGSLEPGSLPSDWQKRAVALQDLPTAELVIRAEIHAGVPSPDQDQGRRMEVQVQRLAEGLGNHGGPETGDPLEALVAAWCLDESRDDLSEEFASRLIRTLEAPRT